MKIYCLMENTSVNNSIECEHGLSIYIETSKHKILFDTGQSDAYIRNAVKMNIDLSKVDIFILSHGHYDHGGGISAFLELNKSASIYINKGAFAQCYNVQNKYIGLDIKLNQALSTIPDRVFYVDDYYKIDSYLELFSCNDKDKKYPVDCAGLKIRKNDLFFDETFAHEQYLLINEDSKLSLISGCSHKGILNIMDWFKPDILIGGFHFMKQEIVNNKNNTLEKASEELLSYNTKYYTGHCTGVSQYDFLKARMKDSISYLSAGTVIDI